MAEIPEQFRGSEVDDISIVRQMPNLEICSVSVNDITTLKDFEESQNLQELYIRNNKIEDLRDICYLKGLEKLRILWLADNPCATGENYRMTVIINLPQLQKLDNVDDEERTASKDKGEELSLPQSDEESELTNDLPVSNGETPLAGDTSQQDVKTLPKDPVTLSWEETNNVGNCLIRSGLIDPKIAAVSKKDEELSCGVETLVKVLVELGKIREQLGLKPLPIEKIGLQKSAPTSSTRTRNAHILQAVLILVKELDRDSLEIVDTAIKRRLDSL